MRKGKGLTGMRGSQKGAGKLRHSNMGPVMLDVSYRDLAARRGPTEPGHLAQQVRGTLAAPGVSRELLEGSHGTLAIKFGGKYTSRMPQVQASGAEENEIYSWPPQIATDASRRSIPEAEPATSPPGPKGAANAGGDRPRFLQLLEEHVAAELLRLEDVDAGFDPGQPSSTRTRYRYARLQVFQAALKLLADKFSAYGPFLHAVRHEYDSFVEYLLESEHSFETIASTQRREMDGFVRFKESAQRTQGDLAGRLEVLTRDHADKSSRLLGLEAQNAALAEELAATTADRNELQRQKSLLVQRVHTYRQQASELEREVQAENYERVRSQKALLGQVEAANAEADRLRGEASAMANRLRQQGLDLERLELQVTSAEGEGEEDGAKRGELTPRPDWGATRAADAELEELLGGGGDESTLGLTAKLLAEVYRLKEANHALAQQVPREQKSSRRKVVDDDPDAPWNQDYFVAFGTGASVPKYLRYSGKVRNRRFSKKDTEAFIRSVWKAKGEARGAAGGEHMREYLFHHLKGKFGIQATIVEWGYNLHFALERYLDDPDVHMFHAVLHAKISEDIYHENRTMVEGLLYVLKQADAALQASGKPVGRLPKALFRQAVADFFEDKPRRELQELWAALDEGFPEDAVRYKKVFEDDKDFNQSEFAELLRNQHVTARFRYLEQLREALLDHARGGKVTLSDMRRGFLTLDPAVDEEDLQQMISRGCGMPYEEIFSTPLHRDNPDGLFELHVSKFMQNLMLSAGVARNAKRERNRAARAVLATQRLSGLKKRGGKK